MTKKKKKRMPGAYYTPKHIRDYILGLPFVSGSGGFLKDIADKIRKGMTQNPPFKK